MKKLSKTKDSDLSDDEKTYPETKIYEIYLTLYSQILKKFL